MKKNDFYNKVSIELGKLTYVGFEDLPEFKENKETGESERTGRSAGLKIQVMSQQFKEIFDVKIEGIAESYVENIAYMQEVGFENLAIRPYERGFEIKLSIKATDIFIGENNEYEL